MLDPKFAGKPITALYSSRTDVQQMPETRNRVVHHRRAQSETFFRFPDDIHLDDVVADFDLSSIDLPSLSSETRMTVESDSNGADKPKRSRQVGPGSHFRSLSLDADFFDGLGIADGSGGGEANGFGGNPAAAAARQQRYHHGHSDSMDGSTATSFESEMSMMMDNAKKSLGPDKLAELSLIDPKRAKRILANRQSAARSKERKVRYMSELERKVQTLQTEATNLSAQVTMMQRDTSGLTIENKELKLRLQALEQQAHLRAALNDTLREEVNRLKMETGQVPAANGNGFSRALPPQFPTHSTSFHHFVNHQAPPLPPQPQPQPQPQQQQQQLQMPHSTSNNNQTQSGQLQPSFADFNQRI